MTLYQEIIKQGFDIDSRESDLYVKATKEFMRFIKGKPVNGFNLFKSQIDGEIWAELPFMFDPWWEERGLK